MNTKITETPEKTQYCTGHRFCFWAAIRIAIVVFLIIGAFVLGTHFGKGYGYDNIYNSDRYDSHRDMMMQDKMERRIDLMAEHCKTMPEMMGCEKYKTTTSTGMNHDMMGMSMSDMSKMLEGKTGDELNKAFLQGMIPHHQGAIDMARYMLTSNKPELVKLAGEIIVAQQKEIDQMNKWLVEWGYTNTGLTNTGMMNMSGMMMQ